MDSTAVLVVLLCLYHLLGAYNENLAARAEIVGFVRV